MQDKVELLINNRRVELFQAYRIESDLYTPADAFSLTLSNPDFQITRGQTCQVLVNGTLEMSGIIDRTIRSVNKQGRTFKVEGRDLLGLVVDHFLEEFIDLEGYSLKALAEKLLKTIPFINRKTVVFGAEQKPVETEDTVMKIEPGDTAFAVLSRFAAARGLLFYSRPDGTFVFGKPKAKGNAEFQITLREDGVGNNAEEGSVTEDISRRFSKVVVLGQQQGGEDVDVEDINTYGSASDQTFPFFKPFVQTMNHSASAPSLLARMTLEQQRAEGLILEYVVKGHSQRGKNWTPNALCRVEDTVNGFTGLALIYGRTFEGDKRKPLTRVRLGLPGVIAA
jgi:prophage tail gpP-like protein